MGKFLLNAPQVESSSHKVVLVIDRSPKFAESVPKATVTFSLKDDQNASIMGKLEKKLWSTSIEAVMEFHRVVTDLFPRGDKCLRFVISDFVGRFLTPGWSSGSVISHEQLLDAFVTCDMPKAGGDVSSCSILNGILLGLEALSEQTVLQHKVMEKMKRTAGKTASCRKNVAEANKLTHSTEDGTSETTDSNQWNTVKNKANSPVAKERKRDGRVREQLQKNTEGNYFRIRNRGSLVVITSLESSAEFDTINEYIAEQIVALNEGSRTSTEKKFSILVDQINLYVLNIAMDPNKMFSKEKHRRNFHARLISVNAGPALVVGVHKVLQDIYGLVSTTVCGIPMKEEAQSGQSTNYDVEMLHPRSAHFALTSLGLLSGETKMIENATAHENLFTSVRLKWCTASPKLKSDKFPILQRSFPITPAYVSLRQSVCLTSFITNGKSVLLEVFLDAYQGRAELAKLTPNLHQKLISHYLSRDVNGALLLHCVAMGEKANFGGKLSSEYVYGPKGCSAESVVALNRTAMTQFIQAAQIVPFPNEQFQLVEEDESDCGDDEEGNSETENTSVRRLLQGTSTGRRRQNEEQMLNLELLSRGMPFMISESFDLSGTQPQQTQKRKGAFSPSRGNATAKKAKKDLWETGEKININEWLQKRYEQEYWSGWKGDFEGRLKYGDKAQEFLYPNLKLPPGQMKYTGTGGAGPIE